MKVSYYLIRELEDIVVKVNEEESSNNYYNLDDEDSEQLYKRNYDKVVKQLRLMVFGE